MKKLLYLFAIVGMTALTGCEGDPGPQGIPGQDGEEAYVYETPPVDFTASGDFGVFYDFPITFLESDHVLVYRLSGVLPDGTQVWKPLPESYYFDDGTLDFMYSFDHTRYDVNIVMDGFDLGGINANFRLDQIFRIVVIPGQFAKSSAKVDLNDYKAVIKAYNIDENKIVTLQPKAKS